MDRLFQDLRYAIRQLIRTPGFTVTTVGTLALAIGATTAMLSVFDSVVLRPLPYRDPATLAYVTSTSNGQPDFLSALDFRDYWAQSHSFSDVAPYEAGNTATLARDHAPAVRLSAAVVGANFFSVLGVPAAIGRTFAPGDDDPSAPKTVMLSHRVWSSLFASDSGIVGRSVVLEGRFCTVIGVAPSGFTYPSAPDVWTPLVFTPRDVAPTSRGSRSFEAVGRLAPGVTADAARRDLTAIAARLAQEDPGHNARTGAFVQLLQDRVVGPSGQALATMLAGVGLVFLIACANVANLMLVRAAGRETEIAVRSALGAARSRILRQVLTESVVVSAAGAALGVFLAGRLVDLMVRFGPRELPRLSEIGVNGGVLAVTVGIAVATGLVLGLVPGLHSLRSDISQMLRRGPRTAAPSGARTRNVLVAAEMALAILLLVGAGLLLQSYERLTHVDPGFRPDHLLTFNVSLPSSTYPYDKETLQFADQALAQIKALPGVIDAAVEAGRPIQPDAPFMAEAKVRSFSGSGPWSSADAPFVRLFAVGPSFFSTFRIPLVQGRAFTDAENTPHGQTVVVNEEFVRRYSADQDPIGRRLLVGLQHNVSGASGDTVRSGGDIVGVAGDVKAGSLRDAPVPTVYLAYGANPFGVSITARTARDPASIEREVRARVGAIDPEAAVYDLTTMDDEIAASVSQSRFYSLLLTGFSGLALLLAALGVFGVVSYAVSQRTRELGIRVALGAAPRDLLRLVIRNGVAVAGVGVLVGAGAAALLTRQLTEFLYGVTPLDPLTFGGAAAVLLFAAAAASLIPARRAAQVDPVVAMRAE